LFEWLNGIKSGKKWTEGRVQRMGAGDRGGWILKLEKGGYVPTGDLRGNKFCEVIDAELWLASWLASMVLCFVCLCSPQEGTIHRTSQPKLVIVKANTGTLTGLAESQMISQFLQHCVR
jgi:hypothetical protein